jgi:hypothetical protein
LQSPRIRPFLAAAAPFVVGAVLRLWNLRDQILGGDETHALRSAVNSTLSRILITYQPSDNCIPLTALYKLFMIAGVPMTEMAFRLPVLLCGLAALLALPAGLEGRVSRGTILVFRWLLAISPALVLYSRIARSYMPMVLFAGGAVLAFEAWWRTRSWRSGGAYVLLGALAVWFHLGAGPIVAAPFLFATGEALIRRDRLGKDLRDLLVLGLALIGAFALFLVPALESLREVVGEKRIEQSIPWRVVIPGILRLQAGTAVGGLAALFWLAALAGLVLLARRDRRFALYTATVVVGHVAGLLILSPMGLESPVIFGRYLLPVLPFVLVWVAALFGGKGNKGLQGLQRLEGQQGESPEVPEVSVVSEVSRWLFPLFVAALLALGPFADPLDRRTSFLHHNDFVGFYRPRPVVPAAAVPELYRQLHGETVVEFPWLFIWETNHAFYLYQEIHRGRVIVSSPQRILYRSPLVLRNVVEPDPEAICGTGARYLILHRNVAREEDGIAPGGRLSDEELAQPLRRLMRESSAALTDRAMEEWGRPVYADRWLKAWDLSAVCGHGAQRAAPAASASAATASPARKLPGR